GALRQILFQLFDLRALAPDDDPRPRRADRNSQLVAGAVDLDGAHACRLQPLAQILLKLQILLQELRVTLLGKPPRAPGLVKPEAETVRMNFLSHSYSS